ncbi:MAG: ATP-binding protein [Planctomycetota bacterium]
MTLTAIQGPDSGKKFALPPREPQLIGRSSEALPIDDTTVSRRHAELTPDADDWHIRDLDSQNGTFVNGVRISGRVQLQLGDQIRVGSSLYVFGQGRDDDPALVRVSGEVETEVEHRIASSEDSVAFESPPRADAAVEHLRVIYRLTELTTQITAARDLLHAVMDLVFEEFRPQRGVIMLGRPGDEQLSPAVVRQGDDPARPGTEDDAPFTVSRTILAAAIDDGEGVLSSNAMSDPRFKAGDSVQQYQIRSALCSPVRFRDQTFGAIYIDSSTTNLTFSKEQLALMNAIGRHTALALANIDQAQRRLHAERLAAVGEAVASLSHSIKNILQGLRGGADLVEIGLTKDDQKTVRNGWDILKRNLDRIVQLTMNMLAFGRRPTLELEATKLARLVEDCVRLLEPSCAERGIALIADVDHEMPPIHVDPGLIHQAVMNLLGNAVEAVEAGEGAVTVRAVFHEPAGGPIAARGVLTPSPWCEITVIDNGPGIPTEKLGWIFEPFNTTKGLRGTGLGLAVTRRIASDHRGRIRVESAQGRGSAFRLLIPADLDAQIDPSATANATAADLLGPM